MASLRDTGLCGHLQGPGTAGLSQMGSVRVQGADAAAFLHSQLTNDVEGLAPGEGNLNARVQRTGHLVECFSLHRLADEGEAQVFLLLGEGS